MSSSPRVLIAGGGLSGLCAANELAKHNISFTLLEARDRLGGRIFSQPLSAANAWHAERESAVDMGPSWFWPGQHNVTHLIDELELSDSVYRQASEGLSVVEYANGTIEKAQGVASMAGSFRLDGGMQCLIDSLERRIVKAGEIVLRSRVTAFSRESGSQVTSVVKDSVERLQHSECVIVAIPPRIVSRTIEFEPGLLTQEHAALESLPTWMAAQAKFVAVYDQPFWQADGLSGDAFSQLGPLVEIHDASPRKGNKYALFGFVGIDAAQRHKTGMDIEKWAIKQLTRLFGAEAGMPHTVHMKDWALDPLTCTDSDLQPTAGSDSAAMLPDTGWNNGIVWAGTETATLGGHSNGYLEGAVEAGIRAARVAKEQLL